MCISTVCLYISSLSWKCSSIFLFSAYRYVRRSFFEGAHIVDPDQVQTFEKLFFCKILVLDLMLIKCLFAFSGRVSLSCVSSTSKFCLASCGWNFSKGWKAAYDFIYWSNACFRFFICTKQRNLFPFASARFISSKNRCQDGWEAWFLWSYFSSKKRKDKSESGTYISCAV